MLYCISVEKIAEHCFWDLTNFTVMLYCISVETFCCKRFQSIAFGIHQSSLYVSPPGQEKCGERVPVFLSPGG